MADMSSLDFAMMVEDTHIDTVLTEYRPRSGPGDQPSSGPLLAVCLTDRLADGLSLVYSFYDSRRRAPLARQLRHSRPYREGAPPWPAACLSRLLGRGLEEDGLQGLLPAPGAPRPARLVAGGEVGAAQGTRLREADLDILSKLSKQGLKWRLEPEAFTGREVGREDDLLDFPVGCAVDIEVARQPSA